MRPIAYTLYVSVLDRIEVDVIDMTLEIVFVADLVFPETALPKR